MKGLFKKILLITLLVNVIFPQNRQISSDVNAVFFPQGYVLESMSGFGYSTATKPSISNISSDNPASLIDFNKFYVFWNNISKSYKNEIEFSGSFIHQFHRMITYSVGFHHTDRKFNDQKGVMFGYQDKFTALFLISGLVLRLWIVEIEFTVADSHLFSGDWRKQTIGKLGFGIRL